jgi:hypothetical protein
VWKNVTIRERPGLRPNGCFYTGTVRGDPHSTVAVSLCHGMVSTVFDVPSCKGRPRKVIPAAKEWACLARCGGACAAVGLEEYY